MSILKVQDTSLCEKIDFIYNRFDLWDSVSYFDLWCYEDNGEEFYYEVCFWDSGTMAYVGLYMVPLPLTAMKQIMSQIFRAYPKVKKIKYINSLNAMGSYWTHCDRIVDFPLCESDLDMRLTKKGRERLRQQYKQLCKNNIVVFEHFPAKTENGINVVRHFIRYKKETHGTEYRVTPMEYISKFHVTDTYCMTVDGEIASLILSCEQCPVLYMDNLSYSRKFAKYSPGMLLYNHYLKEMLKNKRRMYLGDGEYVYKDKYGSVKYQVYNGTVYRNGFWKLYLTEMPKLKTVIRNIFMFS